MTLVGKEFPNLAVDAMNEMGDTFKVNILEEEKSKNKASPVLKVTTFNQPHSGAMRSSSPDEF